MIWEIDDGTREIEGLDERGRPDPAYAAALGLIPAPFGRRALATVVELLVVAVLALPALIGSLPALLAISAGDADAAKQLASGDLLLPIVMLAVSNLLVTIFTIVQLVLHGRKGITLGKAVFGLRSVNVRTLERPGFWRGAVVRYLLLSASCLIPLLGPLLVIALSPFFDPERRGRGWLDQAAATWLVDARAGLNPYDAKRMRIARKAVKTPEHEEQAPLPSLATPVDRDAPAEYTPSGRFSGGVIGAHRQAPAARTETPAPASPVPSGGSLASAAPVAAPATSFAPPAVPVAARPAEVPGGMVDAVPPTLAPKPVSSSTPAPAPAAAPPASAPAPAPVPSAQPASASEPAMPHTPTPPTPAAAATPADPASGVRAVLRLDDGSRIEVRGATLIGRAPAPVAGEGTVQLVPVTDDTRSVSKTHLAVLPARRGVVVLDRGSTNGSAIVRAGAELPLTPGDPTLVQADDVVRFGDRSLTVERV